MARGRFPGAPDVAPGAAVVAGRLGVGPVWRRGVVMAPVPASGRVAPACGRPVSGRPVSARPVLARPVSGRVVEAVGSVSGRAAAVGSGCWARCRRGVEWPGVGGRSAHLRAAVPVSGRAVVAAVPGWASGRDTDGRARTGTARARMRTVRASGGGRAGGRVAAGFDRPAFPGPRWPGPAWLRGPWGLAGGPVLGWGCRGVRRWSSCAFPLVRHVGRGSERVPRAGAVRAGPRGERVLRRAQLAARWRSRCHERWRRVSRSSANRRS